MSLSQQTMRRGRARRPAAGEQKTGLFIYPGRRFRVADMLISAFHVPQSSPLIPVCAFAGRESALRAYRHAVNRERRFLSYGAAGNELL